jgi:hypothetical protein
MAAIAGSNWDKQREEDEVGVCPSAGEQNSIPQLKNQNERPRFTLPPSARKYLGCWTSHI